MGKQRKTWSTDVKEAIVLSVLRGELGVAEAARQHGANESLIHTWKTQFLEAGRARLSGDRQDQGVTTLERENDRLIRIPANPLYFLNHTKNLTPFWSPYFLPFPD